MECQRASTRRKPARDGGFRGVEPGLGNRPAQDVFRPSREATRPDRGTRSGMATGVVPDPPTARKDLCRTRVVLPLIVRSGMTIALPHQPTTPACTNTLRRACSATYSCRSRSRVSSTTSVSFVRTARIASAYRMLNRRTLEPTLVPLAISKYRRPTRPPRAGFTCGGSTPAMRSMISGLLALIPMRNPFDTNAVSAAHPRRSISPFTSSPAPTQARPSRAPAAEMQRPVSSEIRHLRGRPRRSRAVRTHT